MSPEDEEEARIDRRIGERVRARRMEVGLTQEQLARALGVSYQQVQKYEGGTNRIAAARLARLARRLGVPPEHFLGEADPEGSAAGVVGVTAHGGTQRAALEVAKGFAAIDEPEVRLALAGLVRAVVERGS